MMLKNMSSDALETARKKSPFPSSPENNQLFFHYPSLFLYKEKNKIWFPLPTDRLEQDELEKINQFINNKYLLLNTKSLSNEELAEDLDVYLRGFVSSNTRQLICEFIMAADLGDPTDF